MNVEINQEYKKTLLSLAEEAAEIIQELVNAVAEAVEAIGSKVVEIIMPVVQAILNLIILQYPERRIVWLALHHKKERVRKKNINRILRWFSKKI